MKRCGLVVLILSLSCVAAERPKPAERAVGDRLAVRRDVLSREEPRFRTTEWEELIPADWKPAELLKDVDFGDLSDSDARAQAALERLRKIWNEAPANPTLNGTAIRIPGFIVPLENNGRKLREFLLVPYFGACIHVPPPPANQIILVTVADPLDSNREMEAVWVSGRIEVAATDSAQGASGYRMAAELIEPYEEGLDE